MFTAHICTLLDRCKMFEKSERLPPPLPMRPLAKFNFRKDFPLINHSLCRFPAHKKSTNVMFVLLSPFLQFHFLVSWARGVISCNCCLPLHREGATSQSATCICPALLVQQEISAPSLFIISFQKKKHLPHLQVFLRFSSNQNFSCWSPALFDLHSAQAFFYTFQIELHKNKQTTHIIWFDLTKCKKPSASLNPKVSTKLT